MKKPSPVADKKRDTILLNIAKEVLSLETLETRHWDNHDFHEHAVWNIKEALTRAYEIGRQAGVDK